MPPLPSFVRWPMPFALAPSDASLLDAADRVFDLRARLGGTPDDVLRALFDVTWGLDVPGLWGATFHGERVFRTGTVYDERFTDMTLRLRVVRYAPGEQVVVSAEACTLPLGRRMVQVGDVEPLPGGGTALRWRIGVDLLPWTRPAASVVFPLFEPTFAGTVAALERRFGVA